MPNQIANQAHVQKQIKQLFQQRQPAQRSPLTPTQRYIVNELRDKILQIDGGGKAQFSHWELRKLKDTRTVLLASVIGRVERYLLIGPRGSLQPLEEKDQLAQLALDEAISDAEAKGNS